MPPSRGPLCCKPTFRITHAETNASYTTGWKRFDIEALPTRYLDSPRVCTSSLVRCSLGYVEGNTVQLKGRVACEINTCDELIATEMVFENVLERLDPPEIAGGSRLASCKRAIVRSCNSQETFKYFYGGAVDDRCSPPVSRGEGCLQALPECVT